VRSMFGKTSLARFFSFILFVNQTSRERLNDLRQIHSEDVFGTSLGQV